MFPLALTLYAMQTALSHSHSETLDGIAEQMKKAKQRISSAARAAGETDGRGGVRKEGVKITPYDILSNVSKSEFS